MSTKRPSSGSMVWWRFLKGNLDFKFGYVTYVSGYSIIRLGRWNGDSVGGMVVDISDIEWKPY